MKNKLSQSQIRMMGMTLMIALATLLYRWIVFQKIEQTSALFIGIPTVLALGISLLPPAKSMVGMLLKGTGLALMLSGIVLYEGFVCIAMATPIFALIAVLIGSVVERSKKKNSARMMSLIVFLPMALEGVIPDFEFSRDEVVRVEKVFDRTADEVQLALASELELSQSLPLYLRMGFPKASRVRGRGLGLGSPRCVYFSGGEGSPGDLCLKIVEKSANRVRFQKVKDESHIAHWLTWQDALVEWAPQEDGRVKVVWTLSYRRELDPAWYFAPFERYAVKLAGEYLLSSYFGEPRASF